MSVELIKKYSNNQEVLKLLFSRIIFDPQFIFIAGSNKGITLQKLMGVISIPECLDGEPNATIRPMFNESFSLEEHMKLREQIFEKFVDDNQQYFNKIGEEYLVSYELIFDILKFNPKDAIGIQNLEFILPFIYDKDWFHKIAKEYYIPLCSSPELIEDRFFCKGKEMTENQIQSSNDFFKHIFEKYHKE